MIPNYAWWFTGLVAAAVVLVDLILALNRTPGDTYSEVLREWGRRRLPVIIVISFVMGLLAGHWWWTSCDDCGGVP